MPPKPFRVITPYVNVRTAHAVLNCNGWGCQGGRHPFFCFFCFFPSLPYFRGWGVRGSWTCPDFNHNQKAFEPLRCALGRCSKASAGAPSFFLFSSSPPEQFTEVCSCRMPACEHASAHVFCLIGVYSPASYNESKLYQNRLPEIN